MCSSLFSRFPCRGVAVLLVLVVVLVGCGAKPQAQTEPTPIPLVQPPDQEIAPEQPEPVTTTDLADIPGRLLFVQRGTVWLWQGTNIQPLFGAGGAWQPEWSPDGRRIAYIERGESYSNIMLADANGEPLAQLTSYGSELPLRSHERIFDTMWAFYPTWSPDGDTLAMASQYGPPVSSAGGGVEYNLALYTLPAGGGSRTLLYSDDTAHCGMSTYTPDGSTLVFARASLDSTGQQLYLLDLETNVSAPFPGAPAYSYDPAFSRHGNWLAFTARDQEGSDIWLLPANPDEERYVPPQRLTNLGRARSPVFSPDDRMVAFLAIPEGGSEFELWVVELESEAGDLPRAGDPRQITENMRIDADSGLSWTQ